jgi:hypothetical protein
VHSQLRGLLGLRGAVGGGGGDCGVRYGSRAGPVGRDGGSPLAGWRARRRRRRRALWAVCSRGSRRDCRRRLRAVAVAVAGVHGYLGLGSTLGGVWGCGSRRTESDIGGRRGCGMM